MVLITDDRDGGGASLVRVKQLHQQQQKAQVHPGTAGELVSHSDDEDCLSSCENGVDLEVGAEQEGAEEDDQFEEVDLEDLDECRSITSDDSFYPPNDAFVDWSPPSPESLSFFQACCTNNAAILRIMIRKGVKEEEVKERDRNNRVGTGRLLSHYD